MNLFNKMKLKSQVLIDLLMLLLLVGALALMILII